MATIRKGDTVRFTGRGNACLQTGREYVVDKASSSHLKVIYRWMDQPVNSSWLLIENFELVRSVYVEKVFHVLVLKDRAGREFAYSMIFGPDGRYPNYRNKEHAEQDYRNAGFEPIGWKKVTLPFRVLENNNG